ncbi:type II secretion system protein [Desulforhopalus sp. 52FAK]
MKPKNRQGFTLIELSIVLVILGLIVGTVTPLIISITKKNKLTGGRKIVETARDEIKGDFLQNRILTSDLTSIGHTIDPWKNDLVYIPAPNLDGIDLCSWLAGGTNQTGLSVCLDGNCTSGKKDNVAFVIASIGQNFNRQMEAATNIDGIGGDREVRIYSYGTEIDRYTADVNRATDQFDDIIQYVTVDELALLVSCTIVLDNQTGQTICSHGAAIDNDSDVGIINYNQQFSLGSTMDNCTTIDSTCEILYDTALAEDTDKNGRVELDQVPPSCALNNG